MDEYQEVIQAALLLRDELPTMLDEDFLEVDTKLKALIQAAIEAIEPKAIADAVKALADFIRSHKDLETRFDELLGGNWMGAAAPHPMRRGVPEEVKVLYATDRAASGDSKLETFYSWEPAKPEVGGEIAWGRCIVTIPGSHKKGELESPGLIGQLWGADPSKYVVLKTIVPLAPSEFNSFALAQLGGASSEALIFIHGYNVSFGDAMRRTAQLCHDLKFEGLKSCFSWPSRAQYMAYGWDSDKSEEAAAHLAEMIRRIRSLQPGLRLHLIAHSMGNRVMTLALQELSRESEALRSTVQEVVLAAPDIDRVRFSQLAKAVCSSAQRVTLYASSNDKALWLSKLFHRGPRAGDSGADMMVPDGIDGIDASRVDSSLLSVAHGYFANKPSVLTDIATLLCSGLPPGKRGLQLAASGKYWLF